MNAGLIAAVVVTYNRKGLLLNCLAALASQSRKPDLIVVVDNASSDGTPEQLQSTGWMNHPIVRYTRLDQNTGGAGGFSAGVRIAMDLAADWMWLMDDDALPRPDALLQLMRFADRRDRVYGSIATQGSAPCWPVLCVDRPGQLIASVDELPATVEVVFLPFLGFMVNRLVVERIGVPDAGFFLAADDVEYSMRAQRAGFKTIAVSGSRIEHPAANLYYVRIPGRKLTCLRLPPWKRYYDTRNRLLVAKEYYGLRLYTQTVPGSLLRMLATLLHEPRKLAQLLAFFAGFIDGVLGRKGKRHQRWRIPV